ncbi:hypothetical protein K438DRAFT_1756351 [Mycena galopus ATCC 62051]|nr:hypothetical protein K438DRAFT_1756351 [Mycena galopus ATCC 62051]
MSGTPTTEGVPTASLAQTLTTDAQVAPPSTEIPASESKSASNRPAPTSSSPVPQTEAELAESRDVVDPSGVPEPKTSPPSTISPSRHGRAASMGAPSLFTNADGQTIAGSTFINGAGTTGPNATAEHNASLHQRAASADAMLSEEQKAKIAKNGGEYCVIGNKQLAKIIQNEAKVEKKALNIALKELAELQKIQKTAVKREAKAQAAYTKTLSTFQKHEAAFLAARSKYEASQALLTSNSDTLEISRANAKEATSSMQEKSQEVDGLRTMFDVDERERAVKLGDLGVSPNRSRFSMLVG